MIHEEARRTVSRLWLLAFAGIVAVLAPAPSVRAGELALEQVLAGAPFSLPPDIGSGEEERNPVAAFSTANGVYELDTKKQVVRVWPKAARKGELKACRLNGVDSSKAGARFANAVSFCKKPGENVIAVVDACSDLPRIPQYSRIAFYSFAETLSDGVLSAVTFTFQGEIRNAALANASDVAFFPSGDKVAVSISRHSSGPSTEDEGAVQFYAVPTSADTPVTDPVNSFLCVRTKNVYEGSLSNTGAEPYNVPISSICVDPDGARIWTGSECLSAVVRYDPVSGDTYDETITIRFWEWDMIMGPQWDPDSVTYFSAATADFVQGARGVTNLMSKKLSDVIQSSAIETGSLTEAYSKGGRYYPSATFDFSGVDASAISALDGKGFSFTCAQNCDEVFQFTFDASTSDCRIEGSTTRGSGTHNYIIGIGDCSSGVDIVNKMFDFAYENPLTGTPESVDTPNSIAVSHSNTIDRTGDAKFVLWGNVGGGYATAEQAKNHVFSPGMGLVDCSSFDVDLTPASIATPPGFDAGDLGMAGSTNNLLSAPGSIQMWASPNGNLLIVADTDNDRVVAFDAMGNARFTFNPTDRQASKFSRPRGAWVSEDGTELVVADTGNGRVEVFALTEADSALDETIDVAGETPFFWETDTGWFTNWIVATTASTEARTYTVTVESDPAGCVAIEQATVTLPAGATRVPFAIRPLDGVENGTVCTLSITGWETNAVFVVSNVPPSVRTGPTTVTGEEVDNGSYLYIDEGTVMDVSETLIPMDENPGLLLARPGEGGAIHFHAKAFDVMADDLTYRWDIVGTRNTLSDPVYRTTPYYYYEYEEGVPPVAKTKVFTPEEVADFPEDGSGNKLYVEVRQSQQAPDEQLFVTNVLSYAETTNRLTRNVQLDWAAFLFDDEQGADFVCSTATLDGPDAEFSALEEGVTYFAILTVTDKDGGVWRSLTSPDESYVCFVYAEPQIPPQPSTAVYSAVFTAMSPTNVAFVVTLVSGEPADNDTVTLESAPDFIAGPWTKVKKFTIGNRLSTTSEPTEAHRSFPVDFTSEYMSACYSLGDGSKFPTTLAWGTNDALPLTYEQVSNIANDGNSIFTDNEKAVAQRIINELGTIFSDRYTNLPGLTSDDLAVLKVRVVSQSEIDVIYPSTKTVANTDPLEYSFSPSQNNLFFRVVQP